MVFVVKNTRISVLDVICPHYCMGCGAIGSVLCECCKNNILVEHENVCPKCHEKTETLKCKKCKLPGRGCVTVGWRDELVGQMAERYKYHSVRAMGHTLAELLSSVIPRLDGEVVLVPLPTINKHIRERGLDHSWEIAKELAKIRGWKVERLLMRAKNTVQVGADKEQRKKQAKKAYKLTFGAKLKKNVTYVLIDDVWTTGASMLAAEALFEKHGANNILMAVLAVSRNELKQD